MSKPKAKWKTFISGELKVMVTSILQGVFIMTGIRLMAWLLDWPLPWFHIT